MVQRLDPRGDRPVAGGIVGRGVEDPFAASPRHVGGSGGPRRGDGGGPAEPRPRAGQQGVRALRDATVLVDYFRDLPTALAFVEALDEPRHLVGGQRRRAPRRGSRRQRAGVARRGARAVPRARRRRRDRPRGRTAEAALGTEPRGRAGHAQPQAFPDARLGDHALLTRRVARRRRSGCNARANRQRARSRRGPGSAHEPGGAGCRRGAEACEADRGRSHQTETKGTVHRGYPLGMAAPMRHPPRC